MLLIRSSHLLRTMRPVQINCPNSADIHPTLCSTNYVTRWCVMDLRVNPCILYFFWHHWCSVRFPYCLGRLRSVAMSPNFVTLRVDYIWDIYDPYIVFIPCRHSVIISALNRTGHCTAQDLWCAITRTLWPCLSLAFQSHDHSWLLYYNIHYTTSLLCAISPCITFLQYALRGGTSLLHRGIPHDVETYRCVLILIRHGGP